MKHFTITELCYSDTAKAKKIDNTPTPGITQNLERLTANILDPLREAWGGPIDVTSGYRCPALNKAVGGVGNSQHMTGQAADIRIYARDKDGKYVKDKKGNKIVDRAANRKLFQKIQELGLPFDQLIDESNFSWVHVSYDASRMRKQVLKL
ncbi:MAG: D-Ala-D-Ala carboxypeptidase family metallohydrolase [Staphylococcus sp.]|nr:D-Ala-D-Ala carboxypeptidase family metallohydrolase [Staphylococcus sp.]